MKKTVSLLGWLLAGVLLVLNPTTGLTRAPEAVATLALDDPTTTTTTTSAVAPASNLPSTSTTTTTEAPTTTTTTTTNADGTVTVTGGVANTRFGGFQVEITVSDGVLVDIAVLREPGDRRSQRINDQAFPAYESLALDAQGTDFDALSGATITWRAYRASLQSALDAAGL